MQGLLLSGMANYLLFISSYWNYLAMPGIKRYYLFYLYLLYLYLMDCQYISCHILLLVGNPSLIIISYHISHLFC